ncbi:hypothetical protein WAE56_07090 [Iodobacter sp. LRB]|uniref:hypothetical protein n=1 Tax=unclassified Iodobacter TaxID=235634 RepID=UPI000C0F8465|nr:hypothetical protein [Iodobacter sp. BJB302]PHV02375.1 hypothetical protein CSQ88_07545 [Iodobacter sp. BJB302]
MSWNRQHSNIEELMVKVLKKHKALSLQEIVDFLGKSEDVPFTGKTPSNSLFSIIYRREKRREDGNVPKLFLKEIVKGRSLYSLNPENKEYK